MKTIRTILTLALTLVACAVSAQNVMVIEKNDGSKSEFQVDDIKEVTFIKETPKVYWGWFNQNTTKNMTSIPTDANYVTSTSEIGAMTSPVDGLIYVLIPTQYGYLTDNNPKVIVTSQDSAGSVYNWVNKIGHTIFEDKPGTEYNKLTGYTIYSLEVSPNRIFKAFTITIN